jgi:homopolymeric O-antigen transport system ATP-binding protein
MSEVVIRAENLSKRYRLGARFAGYGRLTESLWQTLQASARRRGSNHNGSIENDIWALKDVSLEVNEGEVVGLIGRNGAGKSTLLRILSKITEPTNGRAEIFGTVGSLLDVGTGFHPELTGRENVFLNGSILGMSRRDISRRFDEIVAFAEVAKFIDTPVKRYSSGMYLRLAFSVAAHLEADILIVDEVLSVGDAGFVRKCLSKLDQVAAGGRTVLLVSHNIATVQRLCSSAALLDEGKLLARGVAGEITSRYLAGLASSRIGWERAHPVDKVAYFSRVYLVDEKCVQLDLVTSDMRLGVLIEFVISQPTRLLQLGLALTDANGDIIFGSAPMDSGGDLPQGPGKFKALVRLPREILLPRTYGIMASLWSETQGPIDRVDSIRFHVEGADGLATRVPGGRPGSLAIRCGWDIESDSR